VILYQALLRRIHMVYRTGCVVTALELSKILFLIDPYRDPCHMMLLMDFLAIKAGAFKWLLDFIDNLNDIIPFATIDVVDNTNSSKGTSVLLNEGADAANDEDKNPNAIYRMPVISWNLLPNLMFSRCIALYRLEQQQQPSSTDMTSNSSIMVTNKIKAASSDIIIDFRTPAVDALKEFLLLYPLMIQAFLSKHPKIFEFSKWNSEILHCDFPSSSSTNAQYWKSLFSDTICLNDSVSSLMLLTAEKYGQLIDQEFQLWMFQCIKGFMKMEVDNGNSIQQDSLKIGKIQNMELLRNFLHKKEFRMFDRYQQVTIAELNGDIFPQSIMKITAIHSQMTKLRSVIAILDRNRKKGNKGSIEDEGFNLLNGESSLQMRKLLDSLDQIDKELMLGVDNCFAEMHLTKDGVSALIYDYLHSLIPWMRQNTTSTSTNTNNTNNNNNNNNDNYNNVNNNDETSDRNT